MITVSERHDRITNPPLDASIIHSRSTDDPGSGEVCVRSLEVNGMNVTTSGGDSVSVSVLSIDMHGLK